MKNRKLITALLCATMAIAPMNLNVFSVSAEEVSITDIDQIQEMLTVFLEENNLDASVVSNEKYPGYQPVVVEYNMDAEVDARRAIMDYIIETNIDLYNIGLMPMKDGVSAYLIPIDYSVQGTGCIPNDSDDYDDTGNPSSSTTAIDNPYISYLEEFLELPLGEIETQFEYAPDEYANEVILCINQEQLKKQLADLEPQKEAIGIDYGEFASAYTLLMLEKLHLKDFYDAIAPGCFAMSTPSAWIQNPDFFTISEQEDDSSAFCMVRLQFGNSDITVKYNDETRTITPYEATLRTLYVINKYGNHDYFSMAYIPGNIGPGDIVGETVLILLGDTNCDSKVTIADAVLLSRYVNEDAITISPLGLANAELNSDNQLTMDDVNLILRKIARLD